MGSVFSLPSPMASIPLSLVSEAHTVVPSTLNESPVLQQSSSEDVDVLNIDAGELRTRHSHLLHTNSMHGQLAKKGAGCVHS